MKRTEIDPGLAARLVELLSKRGPLMGLPDDIATRLVSLGQLVELAPDEALMREDDAATPEVYLLLDGALHVRSKSGTLARLSRPGDVVGEVAVLLSSKRTADVVADGAVRVLAIPSKVLTMPEYAQVAEGVSGAMIRDDWIQY